MKTLVVNLLAGPGAGKSTLCGSIFSKLKLRGVECEIAYEFAKELVYEHRDYTFENQIYLFAEQFHRIWRLMGQVKVIITDCPILLSPIYDDQKRASLEQLVVEEHKKMWTYNIFLKRTKPYNPNGRCKDHDFNFAINVDRCILDLLTKHNINYAFATGDNQGADMIVNNILAKLSASEFFNGARL